MPAPVLPVPKQQPNSDAAYAGQARQHQAVLCR